MIGASSARVIAAAQAEIARHQASRQAPRVVWQSLNERAADFDARVIHVRSQLPGNVRIIAVCEPHPQRIDGVRLCELTRPMFELCHPSIPADYLGSYGGRGAGGSWGFARVGIARAVERPTRIMCAREFQNSIAESVHKLLADQIEMLGLSPWFDIRQNSITCANGSEVIFNGIRDNPSKIKSTEAVDVVFLEEAESISAQSWEVLIPTIRKAGSQIWARFNPRQADDPTYQLMVANPLPKSRVLKMSWRDNPWRSSKFDDARLHLQSTDPDAYAHVYEGECIAHSAAQIFAGKYGVESFEPRPWWNGPYIGLDFGFVDPTVCIACYIDDSSGSRILYIAREAWAVGCDLHKIPELLSQIPDVAKHTIRADSAWIQSVNYLKYHGLPKLESVEKWPNSVEEGIKFLRAFDRIVIHERCQHTQEEMRLYSYRVDRLTGDVLDEIVDKHNHCVDAIRYALQPMIRYLGEWTIGTLGPADNARAL